MVLQFFQVISKFQLSVTANNTKLSAAIFTFLLAVSFVKPVYAQEPAKISAVVGVIENIIKLLAPIAAIAFLVMLIVGGFQFVTSGGDPKAAAGARNTLTYAVIGIILVVASWLILVLIGNITGADVTTVRIP